jgi:uncharacterized protein (TIGR03000 family)
MPVTYAGSSAFGGTPTPCCGTYGLAGGVPETPMPPAGLAEAIGPATAPGLVPGMVVPGMVVPGLGEHGMPPLAAGPGETIAPPMVPGGDQTLTTPDRAAVVITLPADAELTIDGQKSDLTGPVRVFRTPPLEAGKDYYYDLLMVVQRGGMKIERREVAKFRAGMVARVTFAEPGTGGMARINVRLPEGAKLTVEGQAVTLPAGAPVFRTPKLEPNRTYYYTLTAEVVRDGQKQTLTRNVAFRAGQEVAVDFADAGQIAQR